MNTQVAPDGNLLKRKSAVRLWLPLVLLIVVAVVTFLCFPNRAEAVGVWVGAAAVLIAGRVVTVGVKETGERVQAAVEEVRRDETVDYAHEIAVVYHQWAGRKAAGLSGTDKDDAWAEIELILYYLREPKTKGVLPGCFGDYINRACEAIVESAPPEKRDRITEDLIESCFNIAVLGKRELWEWSAILHDDVPKESEETGQPAHEVFEARMNNERLNYLTSTGNEWVQPYYRA